MGSPTAPLDLALSELNMSNSSQSDLKGLYLITDLS